MNSHDPQRHEPQQEPPEGKQPLGDPPNGNDELRNVVALGEQIVGLVNDLADLARMEVMLAIRSVPRLLMLWFLMMPIILLTWCSFSAWVGWMVYEATQQAGFGLFVFFLQQLLLLFVCRWFYTKYQLRMTLPYTRKHIDKFIRGFNHGYSGSGETKK